MNDLIERALEAHESARKKKADTNWQTLLGLLAEISINAGGGNVLLSADEEEPFKRREIDGEVVVVKADLFFVFLLVNNYVGRGREKVLGLATRCEKCGSLIHGHTRVTDLVTLGAAIAELHAIGNRGIDPRCPTDREPQGGEAGTEFLCYKCRAVPEGTPFAMIKNRNLIEALDDYFTLFLKDRGLIEDEKDYSE